MTLPLRSQGISVCGIDQFSTTFQSQHQKVLNYKFLNFNRCIVHLFFADVGGPDAEVKPQEAPEARAIGAVAIFLMCLVPAFIITLDAMSFGMRLVAKLESLTVGKNKVMKINTNGNY